MKAYNEDYYIMFKPRGEEQIYIKPQKRTAERGFRYQKTIPEVEPLFFERAYKDKIKNIWPETDVLLESSCFIASTAVYECLRDFKIDSMQIYPAVYVNDSGKYNEDYWYFVFFDELDCIDIEGSELRNIKFNTDDGDDELHLEVKKYSLRADVLDVIDEGNRLMFKMGQCSKKYIFVHKKIVDIFLSNSYSGVRFIKVSDFKEGMQYA